MVEMAQLMGTADAGMLTATADATAVSAGGSAGGSVGIEELLRQLRTEPQDAEECSAKFGLYEGYSEQLEQIRKALFDYFEETSPTVPASVNGDWKRQLKKV